MSGKKYTYGYGKRVVNYSEQIQKNLGETVAYSDYVTNNLSTICDNTVSGLNSLAMGIETVGFSVHWSIPINDGIWSKIKNRIFKDEHPDKNYRL